VKERQEDSDERFSRFVTEVPEIISCFLIIILKNTLTIYTIIY